MNFIYKKKTDKDNLGRPKKYRTERMELKLTVGEAKLLEECSNAMGKTRTEVIVAAIVLLYKKLFPNKGE